MLVSRRVASPTSALRAASCRLFRCEKFAKGAPTRGLANLGDADLYLPARLEGLLGSKRWMAAQMGKAGGKVSTKAKAAASRRNGKLGGRPSKIKEAA